MNTKVFAFITLFLPFVICTKDGESHPIAKYWTIGLETAAVGYALPYATKGFAGAYNGGLRSAFNNPRSIAALYTAGLALSLFNTKYSDIPYSDVVGRDQFFNKVIFAGCFVSVTGAIGAYKDSRKICDMIIASMSTPARQPRLIGAGFLIATAAYAVKNGVCNISKIFNPKQ